MKVLFLDIDGVLNSEQSAIMIHRQLMTGERSINRRTLHSDRADELCPVAMSNLNYIVECCSDTSIVVSSTWRLGEDVESMQEILKSGGFRYPDRIIGLTPCFRKERGYEIEAWLEENQKHNIIDDFVIIDDDSDMVHLSDHLIQTNPEVGLTITLAKNIIERFDGEFTGEFI